MNLFSFSSLTGRPRSGCVRQGFQFETLEKRELLTTAYLPSLFGSAPGYWNELTYRGAFEAGDADDNYFVNLQAGDVFNVTVDQLNGAKPSALVFSDASDRVLMHTNGPIPALPDRSPLSAGSDIGLAYLITTAGLYEIEARSADRGAHGHYTIHFQVFRPALEQQSTGAKQVLFLDFDGARLNPFKTFGDGTDENVGLSPFSSYLEDFGLVDRNSSLVQRVQMENRLIDRIVETVRENLYFDIVRTGMNQPVSTLSPGGGGFDLSIVDSRDGTDLWGRPNVTRVVVGGGNSETGIIGDIAESVDVGNMVTEETALVQVESKTHLINGPLEFLINERLSNQMAAKINLIGTFIGNVISHEAGHLFGLYHTDSANDQHVLMDRALTQFLGDDQVYGTGDDVDLDFGLDTFLASESELLATFIDDGRANNADWLSFALSTGRVNYGDVDGDGIVDARDLNVVGKFWDKQVAPSTRGDLNGDGFVDAIDLNQIGLGWTRRPS